MLRAVKTPADHKTALSRIDRLMEARGGSPEEAELEVLAILVERYEREGFPTEAPSPREDRARLEPERCGSRFPF